MSEYNGYANYETWRVATEILIDYADSLSRVDNFRVDTVADLADHFQEYVESLVDQSFPDVPYGAYDPIKGMVDSFISSVDWYGFADNYADELTRENWHECAECGDFFPQEDMRDDVCIDLCRACADAETEEN